MNPISVRATNYRSYESVDLELPIGCVVIAGPNGAGKSSLLELVPLALFGSPTRSLADYLTVGEEEMSLELTFEHGGELYRVRRMYSAKGRGKSLLDFERAGADESLTGWETLSRETAAATQTAIEQLLGLSRETYLASAHLSQGQGAAFTDAQPRDRKAILSEILGLSIYDRLLDAARIELRQAEHATVAVRTKIETLQEQAAGGEQIQQDLAASRAELAEAVQRQEASEERLERAQAAQAANAAAVERLRNANHQLDSARAAQERARVAYAAAVQASIDREQRQADLDAAAEVAATVPNLERRLTAARDAARIVEQRITIETESDRRLAVRERLAAQIHELRESIAGLRGKADHLDAHISDAASCDRCGQTLGAEAAARAAASYRDEADQRSAQAAQLFDNDTEELAAILELRTQLDALADPEPIEDPAQLEQLLTSARAAGERRAAIAEQVRALAEQAATQDTLAIALADATETVTACEAAVTAAGTHVANGAELQQAVDAARAAVQGLATIVTGNREIIVRLEVAEQRVVTAAAELVACAAEVETISKQVDVLKLAERAFGRDGIPALIVENAAIPQLEVEANRILGELGGATADCRVELRTQRLLKTTESLRETLDIVIVTPAGERPYESFSGGERTRLNLALRIALARLLAHRRGAESRLLAIDEPEFLDEAGVARLADVLRGLSGDFDRVLLVSHHPTLAAAFDQAIVVIKDGDRSRVDVGSDGDAPMAVAA
jgi:exonuclease SbcC